MSHVRTLPFSNVVLGMVAVQTISGLPDHALSFGVFRVGAFEQTSHGAHLEAWLRFASVPESPAAPLLSGHFIPQLCRGAVLRRISEGSPSSKLFEIMP